jgi:serine/threonine-protein kinase OSR1/STK39
MSQPGTFGDNIQWPTKASDYTVENQILGVGASATVHKAKVNSDGRECAIKKIDLEQTRDESDVQKEIKTLSSFKHENITAYYGCFLNKHKLWIIMELMDGESVHSIIHSFEKKRQKMTKPDNYPILPEIDMSIILREVLKGIAYLHQENCIHRDIKAQNILLNRKGEVKLADFGVSSLTGHQGYGGGKARPKTFVGTPCWMAPEVGDVEKHTYGYDSKADMWSFGITCIEMITSKPPYFDMPPIKVILLTIQSPPVNVKSFCEDKGFKISKSLQSIIDYCLKKSPKDRPAANTLLKHDNFIRKASAVKDPKQRIIDLINDERRVRQEKKVVRTKASRDGSGTLKFILESSDDENHADISRDSCDDNDKVDAGNQYNIGNNMVDSSTQNQNQQNSVTGTNTVPPPTSTGQDIGITLRIRTDGNGQLNDIKFPFVEGVDTADSLAHELCEAQLVNIDDKILVSQAMALVIETGEDQTFKLNGRDNVDMVCDPQELYGYARVSLSVEQQTGEAVE